jgi:hypothetical protein
LKGVRLRFSHYRPYREGWDHDHCEFCGKTFSARLGDLSEGYCTLDEYHWICQDCFSDFKEEFGWMVESKPLQGD